MIKQVIVVRTDLNMRKGKIAAQSSHASLGAFIIENEIIENTMTIALNKYALEWITNSFTKIVLGVDSEAKLLSLYTRIKISGIPVVLITDNGATEFHGVKTNTCIGIGPWESNEIDAFTGDLKLI